MKSLFASSLALFATVASALPAPSPEAFPFSLAPRQGACTAAATDNLIFSVSISAFQSARNAKSPACFDWSSDNCSSSPDRPAGFNFVPSCQRHDFGYRNTKKQGRFTALKPRIDTNFKNDMYNVCKQFTGLDSWKGVECRAIADIYYTAVKELGKREDELLVAEAVEEREVEELVLDV